MMIKKGDLVLIRTGKDRGKTAQVGNVLPEIGKAQVVGINILKKNAPPSKKYPKGGIIDIQHPVNMSNLRLICPHCQKITKAKIKLEQNEKQRLCQKCRKNLDTQLKIKQK